MLGYMKNQRAAYYIIGALNSDATLAGTMAPSDYRDDTPLGIIKEGTGSIGGTVDNYGTIEPGNDGIGTLTIRNLVSQAKQPDMTLHPSSVLPFQVHSAEQADALSVGGTLKFSSMDQDFTTSDGMPQIEIVLPDGENFEHQESSVGETELKPGTEFTLLTAKAKQGDWHFELKTPDKKTSKLEERETDGAYALVLILVSLQDPDHPDNPDDSDDTDDEGGMGAFYDDGIDDAKDRQSLRYYANLCDKGIGVAMCIYKGLDSERNEVGRQFNMIVAENEMKMDALQPSQGTFTFSNADQLVNFARNNNMKVRGHCLVWHQQQPQWLSSDGKKNDKNWTRQEALEILKQHIIHVVQHFKGKVMEWDVVNECLDDDQTIVRTNPESYTLRQNVWQRAIGDDYIDSAFVYAHQADPDALLYLNDYGVELQGDSGCGCRFPKAFFR